jgi:hypothetical protein
MKSSNALKFREICMIRRISMGENKFPPGMFGRKLKRPPNNVDSV